MTSIQPFGVPSHLTGYHHTHSRPPHLHRAPRTWVWVLLVDCGYLVACHCTQEPFLRSICYKSQLRGFGPLKLIPHPPGISTLNSRLSTVERQSEAVPFSLHASGSQATGYKADDAASMLAASEWPALAQRTRARPLATALVQLVLTWFECPRVLG